MMIGAEQIRSVRAWLKWTRLDLAKATKLSESTIRNLERGEVSPRCIEAIQIVYDKLGFRFHGKSGFTRCTPETRNYCGQHSRTEFFDELLTFAEKKSGEISIIIRTQKQLARALGATSDAGLRQMESLGKLVPVKCLLFKEQSLSLPLPSIQFRTADSDPMGPHAQFVYGDTTAIMIDNSVSPIFIMVDSVESAYTCRQDFTPRWESASQIGTKLAA